MSPEIVVVGLDLAKNVFQVHGIDAQGQPVVRRQLRRAEMLKLFAMLPPCLVGMEACASANYWSRELGVLGHQARLMPPAYVKAYVKRGKTDAADAEAICEAVTSPTMRFIAVKSEERQAALMLHKTRDLLVQQRTMLINALRAQFGEFGIVKAQGPAGVNSLLALVLEAQDAVPVQLPDKVIQIGNEGAVRALATADPVSGAAEAAVIFCATGKDLCALTGVAGESRSPKLMAVSGTNPAGEVMALSGMLDVLQIVSFMF